MTARTGGPIDAARRLGSTARPAIADSRLTAACSASSTGAGPARPVTHIAAGSTARRTLAGRRLVALTEVSAFCGAFTATPARSSKTTAGLTHAAQTGSTAGTPLIHILQL